MPSSEDTHFDSYTPQTQAKHQILRQYLPAYIKALKNKVSAYHYVDAFAGRGSYGSNNAGSPIIALETLISEGVANRSMISATELNPEYFRELENCLAGHKDLAKLGYKPFIRAGAFSDLIDEVLSQDIYLRNPRVATFSFVDPCGIRGVSLESVVALLSNDFWEVLLFFNYDAISRLLGGIEKNTHDASTLETLWGSEEDFKRLQLELKDLNVPAAREEAVLNHFWRVLGQRSSARYFVPFRFESKKADKTSHYILHCSRSSLAFKIMKHVMSTVGQEEGDQYGRLEFRMDREREIQLTLIRPEIEEQKRRIREMVQQSPCKVSDFTIGWMSRPTDLFSERDYREMIKDLEREGSLCVFDKDNVEPRPALKRPKHKGRPTLGDDLHLRPA